MEPVSASAHSSVVVASPFGSDTGAGTLAAPLLTIQVAVQRVAEGGFVELREGRDDQRVRLVGVRDVTIQPFAGEHAVLDGSTMHPRSGVTAMVEIANSVGVTLPWPRRHRVSHDQAQRDLRRDPRPRERHAHAYLRQPHP